MFNLYFLKIVHDWQTVFEISFFEFTKIFRNLISIQKNVGANELKLRNFTDF